MSEYSVTVLVDASRSFTVKAKSPEHAAEIADELYYEESPSLCHQCSSELEVGDTVGAVVYCDDKEVLDTRYEAERIAALEAECERLRQSMSGLVMRHFVKQWGQAARDAELDQYLGAGIAQLEAERDALRAELAALKAPAQDEREAPVVVATAILGGLFHGGSGPELGEIDIEVCTPALEALQCETVNSSDDVFLPLMSVAQHERILAAWQRTQAAGVPDGERLAELLESVRLGDDEAKPHGSGATYWNNAVLACQVAIRDALAAAMAAKEG